MANNRICGKCERPLIKWKKECEYCRFWSYVDKGNGCWEWTGVVNQDGYGRLNIFGKCRSAHRVAWMLYNNETSEPTLQVLHKCDNPPCVKLEHLFLGTISDNMKDAYRKGRKSNKGEHAPKKVLSLKDIKTIRKLHKADGIKRASLARMYKVNWSTINRILRAETWA